MEKLVVKSKVTESYCVDAMRITIGFWGIAEQVREAIEWAQEQCESFLEKISVLGIGLQNIRMLDDSVKHEGPNSVKAQRVIELNLPADLKLNSYFLNLIRHNNYICDYNVEYYIYDKHRYREVLIAQAIGKAQVQAECIAKKTGKKLLGIDNIYTSMEVYNPPKHILVGPSNSEEYQIEMELSDGLLLETKELSEEIEVTWNVE